MALEKQRLDGQVAIVTGAGRGVGRGIATVLAEAGASVVCSARTRTEIEETVSLIESAGGRAIAVTADVTKKADIDALVRETMSELGRIDIVINNAGGTDVRPFLELSEEEFRYHFDWNCTSAFLLSQAAVPHMLKLGKGSIVNISAAAGRMGTRGLLAYSVAKGACDQLTRGLAQELGPKIRVNAIALGAVMTPGMQGAFDANPSFRAKMEGASPLQTVGSPEDVGLAALYLCSDGCFATSGVFPLDGGMQDSVSPIEIPDL